MRILLAILIAYFTACSEAKAFWGFLEKKDKTERKIEKILSEEVIINNKYQSYDGLFEIKLAIYIPHDSNEIKVISFDDELNELQIEKVNWIIEQAPDKRKTHQLFKPRRVEPFKTESKVNENYEDYAVDYDPDKAYDRISDDKHIINRTFSFNGTEIFKDNRDKVAHFLEIGFSNNTKKIIRIQEKIYQEPEKIINNIFPPAKNSPEAMLNEKYTELKNADEELNALQNAEKSQKKISEFDDGGYSPLEYKVLPEAGIPANNVSDYYTDYSEDGQELDENLLDIYD